jgi:lipopolysaccharide biosynthesis glycosyltransferase
MDIAVASDTAYLPGLLVTLGTAAAHNTSNRKINARVLDTGLTDDDWDFLNERLERFSNRLTLEQIPVPADQFQHIAPGINGNHGTYARLLIPEICDAPRVLYMDVDFLVLRDLSPLFTLELDGTPFAAVKDQWTSSLLWDWKGFENTIQNNTYYNAGMLMINTEQWRKADITRRAMDFMESHYPENTFSDQTALNSIQDIRVHYLEESWNAQGPISFQSLLEGRMLEKIIHFVGNNPWSSYDPRLPSRIWYFCYELLSGTGDAVKNLGLEANRKEVQRDLKRYLRKSLLYKIIGNFAKYNKYQWLIDQATINPNSLESLRRHLEPRLLGYRKHT